jgi:hypothetical protein
MKKATIFVILGLALSSAAFGQTTVQVPYVYPTSVPVTIPTGCSLNGTLATTLVVTCPTVTPPVPPPVVPPISGRTKVVPSGGNDDQLIYAAAAKGPLELSGAFKLPAMTLPANSDIYCDDGSSLSAATSYGTNDIMIDVTASNVKLAGSGGPNACLLTMPLAYAKNLTNPDLSTNQYNHAVAITEGASNVSVSGLRIDKSGGDGVYINNATNFRVLNNIITNPIRNGISPIGNLTNGLIDSNDISQVHNANAGIQDGIDVEPNSPAGFIKGLVISNNKIHDLAGSALCLQGYNINSSTPFAVSVVNNAASNTHLPPVGGYGAFDFSNPNGGMKVTGSGNTYNGMAVTFPPANANLKGKTKTKAHYL